MDEEKEKIKITNSQYLKLMTQQSSLVDYLF